MELKNTRTLQEFNAFFNLAELVRFFDSQQITSDTTFNETTKAQLIKRMIDSRLSCRNVKQDKRFNKSRVSTQVGESLLR